MKHILWVVALSLSLGGCADLFEQDTGPEPSEKKTSSLSLVRGTPQAGRQVAETWCANCHVTSRNTNAGSDIAPAWSKISSDPEKTDTYLKSFLTNPHGEMRNISLSRQQIADVVAYIRSIE